METIESYIDQVVGLLQKLNGLPAIALVALSCIVVGYVLRCIKRFPNDGIPVVAILWGAWYAIIADYSNYNIPLRVDIVRNIFIGLVVGFLAWLFHNQVLKRIEDKWFPSTDQTQPPKV